jgi:hypothetical protein
MKKDGMGEGEDHAVAVCDRYNSYGCAAFDVQ